MKLVITVDAEADNQWDVEAPQTTANLAAMPRFQRLCDRFGFPPTYLCTHEIVTSPNFRGTIAAYASDGRAEVGAHLHPWSTHRSMRLGMESVQHGRIRRSFPPSSWRASSTR